MSVNTEQLRYYTEFKIVKDSIQKLNPEFSLCTILVAYHGDNRNRSSISKEVFNENLWTIYGIPLIGEWIKLEEDQNKETWGSHGGRLIWDSEGLKYEQTTKPFGFVTEEAYKNASWVEILEKDGHTVHEYIKLERCILWSQRYEECDSILEENFGQSMEISVEDANYRDDGYMEIKKFNFSALCILGSQVEPCFESAMIGRQYELNQFKQEVQAMMDEYKRFNTSTDVLNRQNKIDSKKEDNNLSKNKEILFSDVCDKIKILISEYTYRAENNKQYDKYTILNVSESDKNVVVVDRENSYTAYKLPYVTSQTDEGLVVNIDYEAKTNMVIGAVDKTDAIFNVKNEVDTISRDTSERDVEIYSNAKINELMGKLDEVTTKFETAEDEISKLKKHLSVYENEKKQYMEQKHKEMIDTLITSKREEMGKFSEFLEYCNTIDYGKDIPTVEKELKDIRYNFLDKNNPKGKKSFSAIETNVIDNDSVRDSLSDRWDEDIIKHLKKNN